MATRRGEKGEGRARPRTWGLVLCGHALGAGPLPPHCRPRAAAGPAARCCSVNKRGGGVPRRGFAFTSTSGKRPSSTEKTARIPQFLEKSARPSSEGAGRQGLSRGPGCTRQLERREGDASGGGARRAAGGAVGRWVQSQGPGPTKGTKGTERCVSCVSWGQITCPWKEWQSGWERRGVSHSAACPGLGVLSGPLAQACRMLGSGSWPLGAAEARPPCLV